MTELILKTMVTIVSHEEGAVEFIHIQDLTPLWEIAPQYPIALDVFTYAWVNASTVEGEILRTQESIDEVISALLVAFKDTDGVTLVQAVGNILPRLNTEVYPLRSLNRLCTDLLVGIE